MMLNPAPRRLAVVDQNQHDVLLLCSNIQLDMLSSCLVAEKRGSVCFDCCLVSSRRSCSGFDRYLRRCREGKLGVLR